MLVPKRLVIVAAEVVPVVPGGVRAVNPYRLSGYYEPVITDRNTMAFTG
jgi:hypothetical protein